MMGAKGTRFGRNFAIEDLVALDQRKLLEPNPRLISNKLLARKEFIPAKIVNLLAAIWIQFMTHDWFGIHQLNKKEHWDIPLESNDNFPENKMQIEKTQADVNQTDPRFIAYANQNSHWWDCCQIYGNDQERMSSLRTLKHGKLKIQENGLLEFDSVNGCDLTGNQENYWIGLSLLHTIFTKEHNAICDMLHEKYPHYDDNKLFQLARLVNCALIAKIHTIEWTPAILPNRILTKGMDVNWYGILGKKIKSKHIFHSHALSGIPGNNVDHFDVPYSLTEEFAAVYRLHSLLPDTVDICSLTTGQLHESIPFQDTLFRQSRALEEKYKFEDLMYSAGIQYPGALCLHNYPNFLRQLKRADGNIIDLASIDVLRDRERQIPRYNQFRRLLSLPPASSFENLTQEEVRSKELKEVYNDIEDVDLLIGCLAEKFPDNFGFGETAFEIFVLMASRRLMSDRFLSTDYRPEIYTPEGIAWVEDNTMIDVCLRHFPGLKPALSGIKNAFEPWKKIT